MSISDRITALKTSIKDLGESINDAFTSPRGSATKADNSVKLTGKTMEQVKAEMSANLTPHLSGGDVHGTTIGQVGMYSKDEVDVLTGGAIPQGIVPLSNYGTQDYLPVTVSGSSEGASTTGTHKVSAMCLESDGTLVLLRNGTNGSKAGIYYAYVPEAEVGPLTAPVRTNREYRPSYFPEGVRATHLVHASAEVIIGALETSLDREPQGFFISIINGTMDDSLHTGSIISNLDFIKGPGGTWADGRTTSVIAGDEIYFFTQNISVEPFNIVVRRCSVASALNGTLDLLELVTGITSTCLSGVVQNNHITLANVASSYDPADKPAVLLSGTFTARNMNEGSSHGIVAVTREDGLAVRVSVSGQARFGNTAVESGSNYWTLSTVFYPSSNTAIIDEGINDQAQVVAGEGTTPIAVTGSLFTTAWRNTGYSLNGYATVSNRIVTGNGTIFNCMGARSTDQVVLRRTRLGVFNSKFDALKFTFNEVVSSNVTVRDLPTFPSPLGSSLGGAIYMGDNTILLTAYGPRADGAMHTSMARVVLEGGPEDWTYPSVNRGDALLGYKPTTSRRFLADDGISQVDLVTPLCEVKGGEVSVSGYFFRHISDFPKTRPRYINSDLTTSAEILTVPQSVLVTLADNVALLVSTVTGGGSKARFANLVMPQLTDVPAFSICAIRGDDDGHYVVIAKIDDVIVEGSTVKSVVIGDIINPIRVTTSIHSFPQASLSNMLRGGALCFYDTPNAVLIAGPSGYGRRSQATYAPTSEIRLKWDKVGGKFVYVAFPSGDALPLTDRSFFVHPELGFCRAWGGRSGSVESDGFTKCAVGPGYKTEAEYDAWAVGSRSALRVLCSQDVAEGYSVYFTDETPIFMMGNPYTLAPYTVDLKTIKTDPSNSTFYVYIQLLNNTPQYTISLTELPETFDTMFIGTIVTNMTQIESIAVDKVYRVDNIRISTRPAGSAIPVAVGHPIDEAKLSWT